MPSWEWFWEIEPCQTEVKHGDKMENEFTNEIMIKKSFD